jgi:hypothetical protein
MTMIATRRPSSQITRDIELIKRSIHLQDPLPDLTVLEKKLGQATTKALLDDTKRPELFEANQKFEQAKATWAERARLNTELRQLEIEFSESEAAERMARITAAEEHLGRAVAEYKAACLIAAKSLRNLLDEQRRASRVQGANHGLSNLRLHQFSIPHLHPISNQGTLGQSMMEGLQHWETDEVRRAA